MRRLCAERGNEGICGPKISKNLPTKQARVFSFLSNGWKQFVFKNALGYLLCIRGQFFKTRVGVSWRLRVSLHLRNGGAGFILTRRHLLRA
jgi:hypothetical protein